MNGFSILMFIFATCLLLIGLYMFTGHKVEILTGRVAFQNLTKEEWKKIGKWTMITSIGIYILSIIAFLFHFE